MSDTQTEIEQHLIGSIWYEGLNSEQKRKLVEVAMSKYKGNINIEDAIIQAHYICVKNGYIPKPPIVDRDVFDDILREENEEIKKKYKHWGAIFANQELSKKSKSKQKGGKTRGKRVKKSKRNTQKGKGKGKDKSKRG
jgi:hypothetical protein